MPTRNAQVLRWSPASVCDSLDATDNIKGAMASMANLIPDPTTKNMWQCRPAAFKLNNLPTGAGNFAANAFISILEVYGNFAMGWAASNTAGVDQPFVYNLATNTFLTISNITNTGNGTLPTNAASTGVWIPPTIAVVGVKAIFTHPGFAGLGYQFAQVDLTNANSGSCAYTSQNMGGVTTFPTGTIAAWVAQFNGRAYYGINPVAAQPSVIFSDILNPLNTTNAGQALFFGDNEILVVGVGLPLNNVLGGIVQSLIIFKNNNIFQVTGDASISAGGSGALTINALDVDVGTQAANSVTITPKGLSFLAADGIRLVNLTGQVTDPIGNAGDGITVPLSMPLVQSRVNSNCNGTTLRIAYQNSTKSGNPYEEYWYNFPRGVWSGPHTVASSMIAASNNTFIIAPFNQPGALYQSDIVQSSGSVYIEFTAQLTWTYQTSMLPDFNTMSEMWLAEATITLGASSTLSQTINVSAVDEDGNTYEAATINLSTTATIWGQFNWGAALWGGSSQMPRPYQINWPAPVVFRRISIIVAGESGAQVRVGDFFGRFAPLGYLQAQS